MMMMMLMANYTACKISPSSCPHAAYSLVGKVDTDPKTTSPGNKRYMWQLSYFSKGSYEMDTITILTFHMKQLRLREVNNSCSGSPNYMRQNLHLSSGLSSHVLIVKQM